MTVSTADFESRFAALRGRLVSFLFRFTTRSADAEDLAHETYLRAAGALPSFTGQSSLETWVFAIGANLARDSLRA